MLPKFNEHRAVQAAAKSVLDQLQSTLTASDSERSIAIRARRMLADCGIRETWYYDCMAMVLAGSRTCLSVSGKDYVPADDEIGQTSLVTVDLSPSVAGVWGDCARSFFVEQGMPVRSPQNAEFIKGRKALSVLHVNLLSFATPNTTLHEVWEYAATLTRSLGFVNLDYLGNFGHTIELDLSMRDYIEDGNNRPLRFTPLFTFEPHIKSMDGNWGFKHEEIYYFDQQRLLAL